MNRPDHERYHQHGPSSDPYDTEQRELRAMQGLTFTQRVDLASHLCDLCSALLLLAEIGPHYRTEHPNDAPRVTPRQRSTTQPYMTPQPACPECGTADTGAGHDCETTR